MKWTGAHNICVPVCIIIVKKEICKMGQIKVEKNAGGIKGLCVIEPTVHGDARGYFMETYNQKDMEEAGLTMHTGTHILCAPVHFIFTLFIRLTMSLI